VVVKSSSEEEEEEEEDSSECDAEEIALFMRKFKKYMNKKFSKGDKRFNTKSMTKRIYYNCGKHDHFIANCPFERRDDDDGKKKSKFYKKDYKKSDKPYKKKSYGEANIGQEWDSNDESSNSDNDGVAAVAINGTTSSSKSLFPKLNQAKHTYLMAKESKCNVKTKGSSSPRYLISDDDDDASNDDAPLPIGMNEKATIKRLGKELVVQGQLLEIQEDLPEQERQTTCELKKLLKLEKEKMRILPKNLLKARRLSLVSSAQVVLLKTHMMSCKRLIKILKCNLMLFGQALQSLLAHPKLLNPPLAMVVKDAIILILMLFVLKVNILKLSKCL
jgi:hypothetical protein